MCKFCYTGEVNCLGQSKPYGSLIMGGTSNTGVFAGSIEVFVDGIGPALNVMHVSTLQKSQKTAKLWLELPMSTA